MSRSLNSGEKEGKRGERRGGMFEVAKLQLLRSKRKGNEWRRRR
jgi:hypothetical protein